MTAPRHRRRLAIIGNGMTTARLLDELLTRDGTKHYDITVFGDECAGSYNRIMLGTLLQGRELGDIEVKPRSWYRDVGVRLEAGVLVTRLDTEARILETDDGQRHRYDIAVLATGSSAVWPRLPGLEPGARLAGVHVFRTLQDSLSIRRALRPGLRAVVVGGGLLGLEAARALTDNGLTVTVVHRSKVLMNAQLDEAAGLLLGRLIERQGITVAVGETARLLGDGGHVTAVALADGRTLPADLVVFTVGVRPRVDLARDSGVVCDRGVVVDDTLSSSAPGVFAIGECSQHQGRTYGLVAPCWEQAALLARRLCGEEEARYTGSQVYTRLKVAGLDVAAMGLTEPEQADDEVVQVHERRRGTYRKLIVRQGRLVGAILIGDADGAVAAVRAFDRRTPVPDNAMELFYRPSVYLRATPPEAREICNCNHVDEGTLKKAIAQGCGSLSELAACTRAGTGCGSCRPQLARLLAEHGAPSSAVAA